MNILYQFNFFHEIPADQLTKYISKIYNILVDYLYKKYSASRLGGIARIQKYGNPGTPDGRRKGGLISIKTNELLENGFKKAKKHRKPKNSGKLAEFMGIMFGDGHLSRYQATVTTNSETDINHAKYVQRLSYELFNVSSTLNFKKDRRAVDITTSSINLVKWINSKGMPIGNKLKNGLNIPNWILKNKSFKKAFLRGLFDTDGCIYVDKHKIKGILYQNYGWVITSYSKELRSGVLKILEEIGFHPTNTEKQHSVYLRKKVDIKKYFEVIGTNNEKHLKRYNKGRVPKRL